MKKNSNAIIALVVVVLIIGAIIMLSGSSDDTETGSQTASNTGNSQQSSSSPQQSAAPASTGVDRYIPYSDMALADAQGTKRVVFFHADWCPTCNAFQQEIRSEGVPEGITVIKASFDDDVDLKREYGVTVQSTFVLLDEGGNPIMRWPFGQGLSGITDLYDEVANS